MKYFNKIDAKDIYLSPINLEDVSTYVEWLSNPNITDMIHNTKEVISIESEKDFISNSLSNGRHIFSIIRKSDDTLIGNCGLNKIDNIDNTATLGIFIGDTESQNKGYGTQAIKALLNYGFGVLNLNNIDLHVFDFNERAIHCYSKIGFKEYGRRHKAYYVNNKYHDVILMEMLKDDFYSN